MNKLKALKFSFIVVAAAVIVAAAALYHIRQISPASTDIAQTQTTPTPTSAPTSTGSNPSPTKTQTVLNLPIPFTPQAPTGNWDLLHNEACEEASAIMANAYLTGDKDIVMPAGQVESEITNLTNWQDQHFGYHLDTTAQETAQMIQGYFGLQAKVYNNYTLQDIKDQLDMHHVVILPVNGQVIGNPNYKQPGPIYHMLVVRGYTATGLITNDSGTRRGQNYPYDFNTLHNAGADWDHSINTIDQTKKVMIVVWK